MSHIRTQDGIELAYESFGAPHAPPVILIMGLGAQMHVWPYTLCQRLANDGYRVIRFDNRDSGRSTSLEEHGNPSLLKVWLGARMKKKPVVPYTLKDMANDVLALMDELDLQSAHLVGASMGGMIAQIVAAKQRHRVRSLTSIMSSATAPSIPVSRLQVLLQLGRRPRGINRDAYVDYIIRMNRTIGSPGYPMSDDELRELAEMSYNKNASGAGFKRQLVAITHAGDRRSLLKKIKSPTLVIHGADDPVIPVTLGIETASLIRRSKLKIILGMGHDFPEALVPKLSKSLLKHFKKSERRWHKREAKKMLKQLDDTIKISDQSSLSWLNPIDQE